MGVGEVVEEGKEDREGFLHSYVPVERPFTMELEDWRSIRGISCKSSVGYDVLAGVVAF